MRLLLATTNAGKLAEMRHELARIAAEPRWEVVGLHDVPPAGEVLEDRPTFLGNALKKARHYAAATGLLTLADDSGLCVDALDGRPGVRSARYAGEPCNDAANNAKLLRDMDTVADDRRQARFVCAMALALPNSNVAAMVDHVEGVILRLPRGAHGFGYDPLFLLPHLNVTTAELPMEKKSELSHRGKALRRMIAWMRQQPGLGGVM